jgi:hypothetical protein
MPLEPFKIQLIQRFLLDFKKIAVANGVYVVERKDGKNQKTLLNLGLTKKNREDIIKTLSVTDYCNGPELDKDKPGYIWEFGKIIDGREVYIKLKLVESEGATQALCISFHEAEFALCFPCKN